MFCKAVHADNLDGYSSLCVSVCVSPPFKASLIQHLCDFFFFFLNLIRYFWKKYYLTEVRILFIQIISYKYQRDK